MRGEGDETKSTWGGGYRHWFEIPEDPSDRRLLLHFFQANRERIESGDRFVAQPVHGDDRVLELDREAVYLGHADGGDRGWLGFSWKRADELTRPKQDTSLF